MSGWPDRETAEALLKEGEALNPGPWGNHSRYVALCAEKIAAACGMDGEKAYVLGLLHDIGRREGVKHLGHVYDGWVYLNRQGYPDAARICLTHSFNTGRLEDYIGRFDISEDRQRTLRAALDACEFDDYDRLIQLCDAMAGPEGVMGLEKRMGDVKARYGRYPQEKWDKNFSLKAYFGRKCGCDIDALLAEYAC
jgi:putative nucleotidyltransferase with HDIG domain